MVEIFQGNKDEVKRETNQWFDENPGIKVEYVLQDVVVWPCSVRSEVTITVIYEPAFYPNDDIQTAEGVTTTW